MNYLFAISLVVLVGLLTLLRWLRVRCYTTRLCQGKGWRTAFPSATNTEIRTFLEAFATAFGFSKNQKLCFHPDDKIEDIYRAIYTPGEADGLEHAHLFMKLDKIYGTIPDEAMEASTLGTLFEIVRKQK